MRIIGIDPGTQIVGYGIIEKSKKELKLLDYGCIKTTPKLSQSLRLNQIADDLDELIKTWKPAHASVERLFFNKNVKTAITVAEARGVIVQRFAKHKVDASEFTPMQIKLAVCGYGKADKKMVQKMIKIIFSLKKEPKPDDAADAIAAAVCYANTHIHA